MALSREVEGRSIQVSIAHTGKLLLADPASFASLDTFRSWIAHNGSVATPNQILMTPRGRQVKLPTLLSEKEIFVYDRRYLSPPSATLPQPAVPRNELPAPYVHRGPPDTPANQNDLQAWQTLFRAQMEWASDLTHKCAIWSNSTQTRVAETSVIERALLVALENLQTHVRTLEQKQEEARAWTEDTVKHQRFILGSWEDGLAKLANIPVLDGFSEFFHKENSTLQKVNNRADADHEKPLNLGCFVSIENVKTAGSTGGEALRRFQHQVDSLFSAIETITDDSQSLVHKVNRDVAESCELNPQESMRLLEDIQAVAKKVSSDYHHILGLPDSQKSISQVSKMALVHKRTYLPSLKESAGEMDQLLRRTMEKKNALANLAVQHMQSVSAIESMLAPVQPELSALDVVPEGAVAFGNLDYVIRLPHFYGSLLVESLRRREWDERMKADSSTLAEEMATYRNEEERRRRKWARHVGDHPAIDILVGKPLGVEVNLQGEDQPWPYVARQDIQNFQDTLKSVGGMDDTIKEVLQQLRDIDRPTRQQRATAKAFKSGSIHEALLGRSSLLLRGEGEVARSMKDEKTKLEEKLKGSESRVRKLEDLLHRQSQFGRVTGDNLFQTPAQQTSEQHLSHAAQQTGSMPSSPLDNLSRRPSVARRFSANQGAEEKILARRNAALEAELNNERERAAVLQKDATSRAEFEQECQGRIDEANSTKKDLMQNLEAQKREFADERKFLEDDMKKIRVRLEEVEDELDRVLGSRENEKLGTDQAVHDLKIELHKARSDAAEEIQKAQGQTDFIRSDCTLQREKANKLEKKLHNDSQERIALKNKIRDLEIRLQQQSDAQMEHENALRAAHRRLSSDQSTPEKMSSLTEAVMDLAERSANHERELINALAVIRSEKDDLQSTANGALKQISVLEEKIKAEEIKFFTLRETLCEEKAKASALRSELIEERSQLSKLRSKFAEGETGAEALRERVAEEECRVTELSGRLATSDSRAQRLEDELKRWQAEAKDLRSRSETVAARFDVRTVRASELTKRLYAQNVRLEHLLEALGFSVSHRDDSMIVQRISKTVSSSTTEADSNSSMVRSISTPLPRQQSLDSFDDSHMFWPKEEDQDIETSRYNAFMDNINKFKLDVFCEAIMKRVKESEHLARKWQKEARAYRDKSHRSQNEATQKIAFRSFKEGDLALFLPTRNQATRPWAAFNVGAPHFFLREQESHNLRKRDWLLARISKVEERVVDLTRTIAGPEPSISAANNSPHDRQSIASTTDSFDEENPFELSDGLRWYLLDAAEEKPGAPSTPGLGKSTVASANVDAKGSIRMKKSSLGNGGASKTLSKSLDSRRSSTNSKKGVGDSSAIVPSSGSAEGSRASTSAGLPAEIGPDGGSTVAAESTPERGIKQQGDDDLEGIISKPSPIRSIRSAQISPIQSVRQSSRSPSKPMGRPKAQAWDSLWSIDVSLEDGKPKD